MMLIYGEAIYQIAQKTTFGNKLKSVCWLLSSWGICKSWDALTTFCLPFASTFEFCCIVSADLVLGEAGAIAVSLKPSSGLKWSSEDMGNCGGAGISALIFQPLIPRSAISLILSETHFLTSCLEGWASWNACMNANAMLSYTGWMHFETHITSWDGECQSNFQQTLEFSLSFFVLPAEMSCTRHLLWVLNIQIKMRWSRAPGLLFYCAQLYGSLGQKQDWVHLSLLLGD